MNRLEILVKNLLFVVLVMGLLVAGSQILRGVYLIQNIEFAADIPTGELLGAFLGGFRFDLAALCIFNGVFLLILSLPLNYVKQKWMPAVWATLFVLLNLGIFLLNSADIAYFSFARKRMSHEIFSGGKDLFSWEKLDIGSYWYLYLLWMVLLAAIWGLILLIQLKLKQKTVSVGPKTWWKQLIAWSIWPIVGGLLFLGVRGGIQGKPLWPGMAFNSEHLFVGHLKSNSAYSVLFSLFGPDLEVQETMPMGEAVSTVQDLVKNEFDTFVDPAYPLVRTTHFEEPEKRRNVVILILESFNAENCGYYSGLPPTESITPKFDRLSQSGRLFTNFQSNGTRSVQALPGILNSIPELAQKPLIGSTYETNTNYGLGNMLNARGYTTSFFHGGENWVMGFNGYTRISGIENYYGIDEYPNRAEHYDGSWGIFDGQYLDYVLTEHEQVTSPFCSIIFSLSNHHPYALPADFHALDDRQDLDPFLKTTFYSDWALGRFMEQAKTESWYDSTIFVITADHCNHSGSIGDKNQMEYGHVPLLLLGPDIEPAVDTRAACHLHLLPTLIDYLKLETAHASMGVSLLDTLATPTVVNKFVTPIIARDSLAYSLSVAPDTLQKAFRFESAQWIRYNMEQVDWTWSKKQYAHQMNAFFQVAVRLRKDNQVFSPQYLPTPNKD